MPDMYQALDFYWVTARVEGGPVTLLEAMSTGLCCITTPVGLARDIVESGVNAIVVGFDDANAFARPNASVRAPRAPSAHAIGARARETILDTMDVPVTSQGVHKAYDVALAQFDPRICRLRHRAARTASRVRSPRGLLGRDRDPGTARVGRGAHPAGPAGTCTEDHGRDMGETSALDAPTALPAPQLLPATLVRALVRAKVGV